jgi:hypothetical protein
MDAVLQKQKVGSLPLYAVISVWDALASKEAMFCAVAGRRLPWDFIMSMVVNIASSSSGRLAWHGAATRRCCHNSLKYERSC